MKAAPSRTRSVLYVPADKPRAIAKARTLARDMLILDLEDGVAPEHKVQARHNACQALSEGFDCPVLLRVNASGESLRADLAAVAGHTFAGLVLPKAEQTGAVRVLSDVAPLWLMLETPRGVLAAPELAAEDDVVGLIVGTNDLAHALRLHPTPDRFALHYALQSVVLAARAYGKCVLDAVYNNVRDQAGFEVECQQGRLLGFDGKTLIHPDQIDIANHVFGFSEADVKQARAVLEVWEQSRREGKSVTTLGGRLIEELHVAQAREILANWAGQARQSP